MAMLPDAPMPPDRRDLVAAGAVAIAAFALYVATACPTIWVGDGGELTAVPWCFGVAHPPGYPLFTLLYGALMHALPIGEVAWRANVLTAGCAAIAVAFVVLTARLVGAGRRSAVAAGIGLAVTGWFWNQGLSAEVYALDALLVAVAMFATARVRRGATKPRDWLLLGVAIGLAVGHRPPNAIYALILLAWAEIGRRRHGAPARMLIRTLSGAALTGLAYLYLPLAASSDPPMNMGDPDSWSRFVDVVTASVYRRHFASGSLDLTMARLGGVLSALPLQLGLTLIAAVSACLARGATGRFVLAAIVVANLAFASAYNILDNDGFFQPMWIALAILAALGWDRLFTRLSWPGWLAVVAAALPVSWAWHAADRSGVRDVEQYARDVLASARVGSLVFVTGDTARASIACLQVVDGARADLAVMTPSTILPWSVAEVRRRAPAHGLPPLADERDDPAWFAGHVRTLFESGRGVYAMKDGVRAVMARLPTDLASRTELVPAGLLMEFAYVPESANESARLRQSILSRCEEFWRERGIPDPAYIGDPQLDLLPVLYAEARLRAGELQLRAGDVESARVHLEAVAASDTDQREERVARSFVSIGRTLTPRQFGLRARTALDRLRRGAPPAAILDAIGAW